MPIYEYQCQECGERFELYRSMAHRDSETECPKCHAKHPQRLVSMFSKGICSQFYVSPDEPSLFETLHGHPPLHFSEPPRYPKHVPPGQKGEES